MLELYVQESEGKFVRFPARSLAVGEEPRIVFVDKYNRPFWYMKRWLDRYGLSNPLPTKDEIR
jgi:hypothetical protein